MSTFSKVKSIITYPFRIIIFCYYKQKYGKFGVNSYIKSPLRIDCPKNIHIGSNVFVGYKSWLAAVPLTPQKPKLIIEDGCVLGNFNHIYATGPIIIHKNVLTADKVYISDNMHNYEDINIPIMDQKIVPNGVVEIGEGSWLGENVCILGAKIGKHCIVGSNSVVTSDIPDFSVVVGAPAKVIKKYDLKVNTWVKV